MWIFIISLLAISCLGCSDFQLKTNDGAILCGRAMDFAIPMDSQIVVFNRGMNMSSRAPNFRPGLKWTSKYGFIGINAFGHNNVDEGMNEKGLTCGFLTLKSTIYPPIIDGRDNISLAIIDACNWVLGSFSTVDEVMIGFKSVRIWGNVMPPPINVVMGLHMAIHDALGDNLVIEFLDGHVNLYNNPIGVLTNDPIFEYQLQNLALYNGLSSAAPVDAFINGYMLRTLGSGMKLIPGGWSSIDRFVRVATLVRYIDNLDTAIDGVLSATNILDLVYVPSGVMVWYADNNVFEEGTHWGTIKDVTNLVFYYRNTDGALRAVYLNKINFDGKHKPYPIQKSEPLIIDETANVNYQTSAPT